MTIAHEIHALLTKNLKHIHHLEVINESDLHVGHAGHDGRGESHFKITLISDDFKGLNRVQSHRKIYEILGDLVTKRIHALALDIKTYDNIN